jgi:hypothetical protein
MTDHTTTTDPDDVAELLRWARESRPAMGETTAAYVRRLEAEIARLRAHNAELRRAAEGVLEASDEFRAGMGPEWQGDPLTDACDELRAVLDKEPAPDNANALGHLWDAIVKNTQGDLFWIGEILLAEIEKETGYSKARSLAKEAIP